MRAEQLLRRYLEQRRELGEQELVLDGMTVDQVMHLLGARGRVPSPSPVDEPPVSPRVAEPASEATWRQVLAVPPGEPRVEEVGVAPSAKLHPSASAIFETPELVDLAALVRECTRCPLYRSATHPVPGEGNASARLMCVGEAPGAQE
ncbi:MAG: hypothetical protein ACRENC_02875, partial [Gemmatimonadaceae bacterium]